MFLGKIVTFLQIIRPIAALRRCLSPFLQAQRASAGLSPLAFGRQRNALYSVYWIAFLRLKRWKDD